MIIKTIIHIYNKLNNIHNQISFFLQIKKALVQDITVYFSYLDNFFFLTFILIQECSYNDEFKKSTLYCLNVYPIVLKTNAYVVSKLHYIFIIFTLGYLFFPLFIEIYDVTIIFLSYLTYIITMPIIILWDYTVNEFLYNTTIYSISYIITTIVITHEVLLKIHGLTFALGLKSRPNTTSNYYVFLNIILEIMIVYLELVQIIINFEKICKYINPILNLRKTIICYFFLYNISIFLMDSELTFNSILAFFVFMGSASKILHIIFYSGPPSKDNDFYTLTPYIYIFFYIVVMYITWQDFFNVILVLKHAFNYVMYNGKGKAKADAPQSDNSNGNQSGVDPNRNSPGPDPNGGSPGPGPNDGSAGFYTDTRRENRVDDSNETPPHDEDKYENYNPDNFKDYDPFAPGPSNYTYSRWTAINDNIEPENNHVPENPDTSRPKKNRPKKTEEQLEKDRLYDKKRQANMSKQEKDKKNEQARNKRANMTEEEKRKKSEKQKEYKERYKSKRSKEDLEKDRIKNLEYFRNKVDNMTEQERAEYLEKARTKEKKYWDNMTEQGKERKREYNRNYYSTLDEDSKLDYDIRKEKNWKRKLKKNLPKPNIIDTMQNKKRKKDDDKSGPSKKK